MSHAVRVSTIQLPAVIEGRTFAGKQRENLRQILAMLKEAGKRQSDLVLLGEYANLYHRTWTKNKSEYVADSIPGEFTRVIGRTARKYKMNIAMPMFGIRRSVCSSYVVLFDRRGRIVGCYQKAHPTMAEQDVGIRPGSDLPVYELDFGKVGIMTCMDIEYPEVAQVLMLKGAELLLFPHVQAGWGEIDWEIRYRARAVDTGLFLVSACYGYPEGKWIPGKMIGRSGFVGRDGLIVADIGRRVGILSYDLNLDQKRVTEFFFRHGLNRTLAVMASRRPELYRDLSDNKFKEGALRLLESIDI